MLQKIGCIDNLLFNSRHNIKLHADQHINTLARWPTKLLKPDETPTRGLYQNAQHLSHRKCQQQHNDVPATTSPSQARAFRHFVTLQLCSVCYLRSFYVVFSAHNSGKCTSAPWNKPNGFHLGLGVLRLGVLSHSFLNSYFHGLHDDRYIDQGFCILLHPFFWIARRWSLAVYARCWTLKKAHKQHITLAT